MCQHLQPGRGGKTPKPNKTQNLSTLNHSKFSHSCRDAPNLLSLLSQENVGKNKWTVCVCVCVYAPHREKSIYKLLQIILFFFLWKMLMGGPTGFLSPPNGRGFKRVCFEKHQIWLIVSVNLLLLFVEKSPNERVNAFFFLFFLCLGEFSLHTWWTR